MRKPPRPMIEALFPPRIARVEFCIRYAFLIVVYAVTSFLIAWAGESIRAVRNGDIIIFSAFLATVMIMTSWFFLCVFIPRLRDIGLPHWYLVFFFVPVLNLILFVMAFAAPSDSWGAKEGAGGSSSAEKNERQETPPPQGLSEDPY